MTTYHLDTNVLILGVPEGFPDAATQISSLVYAEFLDGLNSARTETVIRTQRDADGLARLYGGGVPFDGEAARIYQVLSAVSLRSGKNSRRRRVDLMIAATAVCHNAVLATYNPSDFDGLEGALEVLDLGSV